MSQFKSWNSYQQFAAATKRDRRFVRAAEHEEFLHEMLRTSKDRIKEFPEEFRLWRAQKGHGWRHDHNDGEVAHRVPTAFPPERMKPIPGRAMEGRANPRGIPMLYLSTTATTAMSEVRPWIGSFVSCGSFETTRDLRIVDLSVYHGADWVFYLEEPSPQEKERAVWIHIDQAFSTPTTSEDDIADYAPTQVIAEVFKYEGYDGIAYKSAFGAKGYNVCLFNLEDAELQSCVLHRAKSAEFAFSQEDNPYWLSESGEITRLSIEIVGRADEE